jgi:hypothetical protein
MQYCISQSLSTLPELNSFSPSLRVKGSIFVFSSRKFKEIKERMIEEEMKKEPAEKILYLLFLHLHISVGNRQHPEGD